MVLAQHPKMFLKFVVLVVVASFVSGQQQARRSLKCDYEVFQVSPENIEDESSIVKLGTSSDYFSCPRDAWAYQAIPTETDWLKNVRIGCYNGDVHISLSANSNTKMRIKCEAARPVDMKCNPHQDWLLPYSGMNVRFSAKISPSSHPVHQIEVEFPDMISIENESIDSFSGYIEFFEIDSLNTRHIVHLSLGKIQTPSSQSPLGPTLHLDTSNGRAVCESSSLTSGTEIYFAGVDGANPRESELKRACLQPNNPCPNKVIGTSCVQDRFCKKLTLNLYNNGILFCHDGSNLLPIEKSFFTGLDTEIHDVPAQSSPTINSRFLIQVYKDDDERVKDIRSEFPSGDEAREIHDDEKFENRPQPPLNVTEGELEKFECHFVSYLLIHPIIWEVTTKNRKLTLLYDYGNDTSIEYRQVEGVSGGLPDQVKIKSSKVEIRITDGMKEIRCSAFYWNSDNKASSSRDLKIRKSRQRQSRLNQQTSGGGGFGRNNNLLPLPSNSKVTNLNSTSRRLISTK